MGVKNCDGMRLLSSWTGSYSCSAVVDGLEVDGAKSVTLEALSINPPNFSGLVKVENVSASSLKLTWLPPSPGSVSVERFEIIGHPGSTLSSDPKIWKTLPPTSFSTVLTEVGEELDYVFAVRACSVKNVCGEGPEGVRVTKSARIPDSGLAPFTTGAVSVRQGNAGVVVTAPWTDAQGGLAKRRVFYRSGPSVPLTGTCSFSIKDASCYPNELVVDVTDPTSPPTDIEISGLADNSTYSFLVRDQDPFGRVNTSTAIVSFATGDLTRPIFSGGGALALATPTDSAVSVAFTAVTPQNVDANGPSEYLVYLTSAPGTGTPPDPCAAGVPIKTQIPAAGYAAGTTVTSTFTGLLPRRTYSACVKARDAATNVSLTVTPLTPVVRTQDLTAPTFDGIQSAAFESDNSCIRLSWNASANTDADLARYKVFLRKEGSATTSVLFVASDKVNVCVSKTDFVFTTNDTVHAYAQACDNASPLYGVENCSTHGVASQKSVLIPDSEPPPSFAGINGVSDSNPKVSGGKTVSWSAPADWSDYRGFRIYDYTSGVLTFLSDCACTAAGCPTAPTSCTVSGLQPYKTYNFLVRAYDAIGNLTSVGTNPYTISRRSDDVQKPAFTSGLVGNWSVNSSDACATAGNGPCLTWSDATDDQYAGEGNTVAYKIYRKAGSTFGWSGGFPTGGTEITAGTTLTLGTYKDPASGLSAGTSYFYTVCAFDAASRLDSDGVGGIDGAGGQCDAAVAQVSIPDLAAPVVFSAVSTSYSASTNAPLWNLTWSLSDNLTPQAQLDVTVRRIETDVTSSVFPSSTDTVVVRQLGITSLANQTGVAGQKKRIAYLITAVDAQGNVGSANLAVVADFAPPATPVVTSPGLNDLVQTFQTTFVGTCDSAAGNVTVVEPAVGSENLLGVVSASCAAGVLNAGVQFREGISLPGIKVTTTKSNGNTISMTHTVRFHKPCPENYVGVPGNATPGLGNANATHGTVSAGNPSGDFCLAEMPMRLGFDKNHKYAGQLVHMSSGVNYNSTIHVPLTTRMGTPINYFTQPHSVAACLKLNTEHGLTSTEGGYGYDLISNSQYNALVLNVLDEPKNWSNGFLGGARSGVLPFVTSSTTTWPADYANAGYSANPTGHHPLLPLRSQSSDYFGFGGGSFDFFKTGLTPSTAQKNRRSLFLRTGAKVLDPHYEILVKDIPVSDLANKVSPIGLSAGFMERASAFYSYSDVNLTNAEQLIFGSSHFLTPSSANDIKWSPTTEMFMVRGDGGLLRTSIDSSNIRASLRCVYIPPPAGMGDVVAPTVDTLAFNFSGNMTIEKGGSWNVSWNIGDNAASDDRLYVQVRRKFSNSQTDFPSLADPVHKQGYNLTTLKDETSFSENSNLTLNSNFGKFVTYLVTVTDPNGNTSDVSLGQAWVFVENACPQGFVGVPGRGDGYVFPAVPGLGSDFNTTGVVAPFCVSKYQMKLQTANTAAQETYSGGRLEPLYNHASGGGQLAAFMNNLSLYLPDARSWGQPITASGLTVEASCAALNTAYGQTGFAALNNVHYMSVLRNIWETSVNWSTNTVGTNVINIGLHSNNIETGLGIYAQASGGWSAAFNDAHGYYGTNGHTALPWHESGTTTSNASAAMKRTHSLSNGGIVWDWTHETVLPDTNVANAGTLGASTLANTTVAGNRKHFSESAQFETKDFGIFSPGSFLNLTIAGSVHKSALGGVLRGFVPHQNYAANLTNFAFTDLALTSNSSRPFRCMFRP